MGLASLRRRRERNEDFAGVQCGRARGRSWLVAALADGVSIRRRWPDGRADHRDGPAVGLPCHAIELGCQRGAGAPAGHAERLARGLQPARLAPPGPKTLTAVACRAGAMPSPTWTAGPGCCATVPACSSRRTTAWSAPTLRASTRAVGLDELLHLDHSQGELHTGDRLLLTSDGIHGVLRTRDIARLLREAASAQGRRRGWPSGARCRQP